MQPLALILALSVTTSNATEVLDTKQLPLPLVCFGGEPSWWLDVKGVSRVFYHDDAGTTSLEMTRVDNAMRRPTTWKITFAGVNKRAIIYSEPGGCSDSDGNTASSHGVFLDMGNTFLRGCCALGTED